MIPLQPIQKLKIKLNLEKLLIWKSYREIKLDQFNLLQLQIKDLLQEKASDLRKIHVIKLNARPQWIKGLIVGTAEMANLRQQKVPRLSLFQDQATILDQMIQAEVNKLISLLNKNTLIRFLVRVFFLNLRDKSFFSHPKSRKMAAIPVVKMGNPLLRKKSIEVSKEEIHSKEFQTFLNNLVETMRDKNGAGIAAPQVGLLKRVFAIEMENNPRYPEKESFPIEIVINPTITPVGEELQDSWEGCLSIPGIRGKLKRYSKINMQGLDRNGKPFEKEFSGFAAIVCQHELDHLDGILFIDRMSSMETLSFLEEYEAYWRKTI